MLLTDTDEFTSLNPHNEVTQHFPIQQPGSVLHFLKNQQSAEKNLPQNKYNKKFRIARCINLPRYMAGANESNATVVDRYIRPFYNDTTSSVPKLQGQDFLTQRFLYRGRDFVPLGKNLMNLQAIMVQPVVMYRAKEFEKELEELEKKKKQYAARKKNTNRRLAAKNKEQPRRRLLSLQDNNSSSSSSSDNYYKSSNSTKGNYTLDYAERVTPSDLKLAILRNPHRVSRHCAQNNVAWKDKSFHWFHVRHYIGTPEQYFFRSDPRAQAGLMAGLKNTTTTNSSSLEGLSNINTTTTSSWWQWLWPWSSTRDTDNLPTARPRGLYPQRNMGHYNWLSSRGSHIQDPSVQGWIDGFIQDVGLEMAEYLLQGVGQVEIMEVQ